MLGFLAPQRKWLRGTPSPRVRLSFPELVKTTSHSQGPRLPAFRGDATQWELTQGRGVCSGSPSMSSISLGAGRPSLSHQKPNVSIPARQEKPVARVTRHHMVGAFLSGETNFQEIL